MSATAAKPANSHLTLRYAVFVGLVYVIFISCALVLGRGAMIDGDAQTYLTPAENLARQGVFSGANAPPFAWEGHRTPAYPMLIALSLRLSGRYEWTLYLAAITAAAAAWCGIRLVEQWNGSRVALHSAGMAFAFLPNSLGLSSQLLTDAIFGHLVFVWIYLLWTGLRTNSPYRFVSCGLLAVFLEGLKPTFFLAFVLLALVGLLLARQWRSWVALALLGLGTIPVPLALALKNRESHGVFTPTLLGQHTTRDYLMARYLAAERGVDERVMRPLVRDEDEATARTMSYPGSFSGRQYLVEKDSVTRFLHDHPVAAVRLMLVEMIRQLVAHQDYAFATFTATVPRWMMWLARLMTLGLWGLCAYGGWRLWGGGDRKPAMLVLGVLLFFLVTGSVSGSVGGRLRFPADITALPLAAIGFSELLRRATLAGSAPVHQPV